MPKNMNVCVRDDNTENNQILYEIILYVYNNFEFYHAYTIFMRDRYLIIIYKNLYLCIEEIIMYKDVYVRIYYKIKINFAATAEF